MGEQTSGAPFADIFRPPPQGDITLQSNDGVEFLVHSAILNVASPVFESLSVVGTAKDAVELSESAETVSLMLRFIYPNKKAPTIASFDVLSQCLLVARKYDLGGMLETLDNQLATITGPQSLLHQDPLRLHQLALQFDLIDTKAAAAPLAMTSKTNFCDPPNLAELVRTHSPASVIRLAAIQGSRATILADVLLKFNKCPIVPGASQLNMFYDLSCLACRKWLDQCKASSSRKGLYANQPPTWVVAWATSTYETLRITPLEKSDHLFDASVLEKFEGSSNVCQDCLKDFEKIRSQRQEFNRWARAIKEALIQRLEGLQHLYAI